MDQFNILLHRHHLRITTQRLAVFNVLSDANEPVSIYSLIESLPSVDRVSIYRILETFEKIGVVKEVYTGWKKRYELSEAFLPHHHHLHCLRCKKTVPLTDNRIESLIKKIADTNAFSVQSHSFEIEGFCQECQTDIKNK